MVPAPYCNYNPGGSAQFGVTPVCVISKCFFLVSIIHRPNLTLSKQTVTQYDSLPKTKGKRHSTSIVDKYEQQYVYTWKKYFSDGYDPRDRFAGIENLDPQLITGLDQWWIEHQRPKGTFWVAENLR